MYKTYHSVCEKIPENRGSKLYQCRDEVTVSKLMRRHTYSPTWGLGQCLCELHIHC